MDSTTGIIMLLIAALILHMIEEVRGGSRTGFPGDEMPLLVFVGINAAIYGFCFVTLIASARNGKLATPFTWVFTAAMLLNGLGRVGVMIARGQYFPGGASAVLLLVVSAYLMFHLLDTV